MITVCNVAVKLADWANSYHSMISDVLVSFKFRNRERKRDEGEQERNRQRRRDSCKWFYICFWYYQSWKQLTSCVTSQLIWSLALGVLEVLQLAVQDIQLLLYLAACFVSHAFAAQLAWLLPSPLPGCSRCCPAPFAWLHPACVCGKGKGASR